MSGHARACMVLTNQLVYSVVVATSIDVKNCLHDHVVRVEVGGGGWRCWEILYKAL